MGEMLREISIVCQQQQTFALHVEAPDIKKAGKLGGQQIEDGVGGVRIVPSANETCRFVEGKVNSGLRRNQLAVDFNVIARPRLVMKVGAPSAVYSDTGFGDQFVRLPP
jgi:hypothetical protein